LISIWNVEVEYEIWFGFATPFHRFWQKTLLKEEMGEIIVLQKIPTIIRTP